MYKIVFFLFFLPLALFGEKYQLSICTVFQDDAPYLKEWIEFHKLQWVEHFYLYNNNSTDNFLEILEPYIKTNEVTLVAWPQKHKPANGHAWNGVQTRAYKNCIKKYGTETKWLAVIDTDEFLFCPTGTPLPKFLKKYKDYAGVCANWLMFGTSNVQDIPPDGLMIEFLIHCSCKNDSVHTHVKSIVQPKYVADCYNPHVFQYINGQFAVDANYQRIEESFSKSISLDKIRINHYWTRTERFLNEVKIPRRAHMYGEDGNKIRKIAKKYNESTDSAILQFVDLLKNTMKK